MRPDLQRHVESALRPLRVSWSLMLVASLAWAGLGLFAAPVVSPSDPPELAPSSKVLAVLGVVSSVATLWVDRKVITAKRMAALVPVPDHALVLRHLLAGHLVLWSFAEVPALFGFAQLLLGGSLGIHLALCAASLSLLALLMPTRARITGRMETVLG